jgi:hypothetical protein
MNHSLQMFQVQIYKSFRKQEHFEKKIGAVQTIRRPPY